MRTRLIVPAVLFCFIAVACKSDPKKLPTREEFEDLVLGAELEEVRAKLGEPDAVGPPVAGVWEGYWEYRKRTINPKTGEPDPSVLLRPDKGRVVYVEYPDDPAPMPPPGVDRLPPTPPYGPT
jgi:hypothetical protein